MFRYNKNDMRIYLNVLWGINPLKTKGGTMKKFRKIALIAVAVIIGIWNIASADNIKLTGAGATFPYPLYAKMFSVYHNNYGIQVNYQAIGSGGGIRQVKAKTVDFGASDAFLNNKELKMFSHPVVHVPITAGAVVVTYNLPFVKELKLTPEIIADIFLGKIKKWNNDKIQAINPGIKLPKTGIFVVHRSDGSGTTFIFSDYLSKVSPVWASNVGRGKALSWPCGLGAKGNPGVAGLVNQTPGAIGYVELIYAIQNNMKYASIRNRSGNYIKPSLTSVKEAAKIKLPDDMRVSLTNTNSKTGYPISGFTWIIVYKDLANGGLSFKKAKAVINMLWWMTHDGQRYCEPLNYVPLSNNARIKAEKIIKSVTYKGKTLIGKKDVAR